MIHESGHGIRPVPEWMVTVSLFTYPVWASVFSYVHQGSSFLLDQLFRGDVRMKQNSAQGSALQETVQHQLMLCVLGARFPESHTVQGALAWQVCKLVKENASALWRLLLSQFLLVAGRLLAARSGCREPCPRWEPTELGRGSQPLLFESKRKWWIIWGKGKMMNPHAVP